MKKLVMMVGDDLRQVQGVNYVINYFVKGKSLFQDIDFSKIYGLQTIDVSVGEQMPIGCELGTVRYTMKRRIRSFLRELLSSKHYAFAMLKYYLNSIRPTKKAVRDYMKSGEKADFILFHDFLTAYYYYKMHHGKVPEKCALIIHRAGDDLDQFFSRCPAFVGKKQQEILGQRDYVYEHIDQVVYISKKAYDKSKVPTNKKCYIYNGIDDLPYQFTEKPADKINFVCVGSMSGWKGQELVVQALMMMPRESLDRLHLYFVGNGAERGNLENQVKEAHLDAYVTFMGERNDVPEILRSQDVFIMPSKNEGLSIATLEGIRAGLFMLLTDVGGNQEVMGEQGGFIILRDAKDIMDKMCKVIDGNLVSRAQKERSRQHFLDHFTTDKFISGYELMFLSL